MPEHATATATAAVDAAARRHPVLVRADQRRGVRRDRDAARDLDPAGRTDRGEHVVNASGVLTLARAANGAALLAVPGGVLRATVRGRGTRPTCTRC